MARPALFTQDRILDAALAVISSRGVASMSIEGIAAEMGGNVGSIYYRFPSRDHLVARLWLRCAANGKVGMLEALAIDDLDDAVEAAALHYPRWARASLAEAQIMAAYERDHLIAEWPDDLADQLAAANHDLIDAIRAFTHRYYGSAGRTQQQAVRFALLDIPVAAIRRYLLAGTPPPVALDARIAAAASAALGDADR